MSLIEVMVTLGLFLMFLAAAGGLVIKASRVLRFSEAKATSLRALTFALDRMTYDLSGAQSVITPRAGSANTLDFLVVDPATLDRLYPPTAPSFPILQLDVAPYMLRITYAVTSQHLDRRVARNGTTISLSQVAERIESLQAVHRSDGVMELKLQVNEERGPRTVSTAVPLLVGIP